MIIVQRQIGKKKNSNDKLDFSFDNDQQDQKPPKKADNEEYDELNKNED